MGPFNVKTMINNNVSVKLNIYHTTVSQTSHTVNQCLYQGTKVVFDFSLSIYSYLICLIFENILLLFSFFFLLFAFTYFFFFLLTSSNQNISYCAASEPPQTHSQAAN